LELDQRNVAGEGRRPANVNRVLPINFCGGPDEIVAELKQCREQIGVGVVDLSFQTPGSEDPDELMEALELVVEIIGCRRSLQANSDLFSWRCRVARRPIRENAIRTQHLPRACNDFGNNVPYSAYLEAFSQTRAPWYSDRGRCVAFYG
jgi:hypothetical protein